MSKITIIHNNRCSKSRCALGEIENSQKKFQIVKYLEGELDEKLLNEILSKSGKTIGEIIRKKEPIYTELFSKKQPSDEALFKAVLKNPVLLERPIVIIGNKANLVRTDAELEWLSTNLG